MSIETINKQNMATMYALAQEVNDLNDQLRHKRPWVGLTWEEIDECFKITPDQYLPAHIYKRIEAKLMSKNT